MCQLTFCIYFVRINRVWGKVLKVSGLQEVSCLGQYTYSVVLKTAEPVRLNSTEGNIHLGGQPLSP